MGCVKRAVVNKVTIESMPPVATGDTSMELRSITDLVELLVWCSFKKKEVLYLNT